MEKQTVFIKRYQSKGELPKKGGNYNSDKGLVFFNSVRNEFEHYYLKDDVNIQYWLEEIELPSEDEIEEASNRYYFDLEEKREKAKNFKGHIASRHPDMLTSREMFAQMSGFVDGVKFLKNHLKSNTNEQI